MLRASGCPDGVRGHSTKFGVGSDGTCRVARVRGSIVAGTVCTSASCAEAPRPWPCARTRRTVILTSGVLYESTTAASCTPAYASRHAPTTARASTTRRHCRSEPNRARQRCSSAHRPARVCQPYSCASRPAFCSPSTVRVRAGGAAARSRRARTFHAAAPVLWPAGTGPKCVGPEVERGVCCDAGSALRACNARGCTHCICTIKHNCKRKRSGGVGAGARPVAPTAGSLQALTGALTPCLRTRRGAA
jgi:hypothetical protein